MTKKDKVLNILGGAGIAWALFMLHKAVKHKATVDYYMEKREKGEEDIDDLADAEEIEGVGGFSTRELEDRVWGFGSYGGGRIHFYASINGREFECENNDTISYERIQEHKYGEPDGLRTPGTEITYKQALQHFYDFAKREYYTYYR